MRDEILDLDVLIDRVFIDDDINIFNSNIQKFFDRYNDKNYYYILDFKMCGKLFDLMKINYSQFIGQFTIITNFSEPLSMNELFDLNLDQSNFDIDVLTKGKVDKDIYDFFVDFSDNIKDDNRSNYIHDNYYNMVMYEFFCELEKKKGTVP